MSGTISDFNFVFEFDRSCSYSSAASNRILTSRRSLNNELFFDKILAVLQIEASHLYPPHSNNELRELHRRIASADMADHHKQSLMFYLLKDFSSQSAGNPAEDFATKCSLPNKYWVFMEGLWEMDRLNFRSAMDYLTRPSLLPTFPEHILNALLRHANAEDLSLPLAYYHAVSPPLTSPDIRDAFFSYLAQMSIVEAYHFLRQQPDDAHKHLFEMLIHEALSAHPVDRRAAKGVELVDLPFDDDEEAWFDTYLLEGNGRSIHGARDTVMMRRIATGRYSQALMDGKHISGRRYDSMTWEAVKDGLERGLSVRKDMDLFELPS